MPIKNLSYEVVKTILNDQERDILLCAFLHAKGEINIQVDYEEAANAVGATTGHAFRLRLGKILKKIKDAGGGMKGGSIPPTATKETPTRKRKAATAVDGTTPTLTPTPKKARKTKGKTGATTADEPVSKGAATAVEEYIGEVAVKQEGPAEDHQELSDYASF